nr:O-antigen polymerase [Bacillus sp. DNRA2]
MLFLIISIVVAILIGNYLMKYKIIEFNRLIYKEYYRWITYAILIGYFIEFLYHRNFPLLAIFTGNSLSYHEFGIPTFHVFLVTFNSFFSIFLFQVILSEKEKRTKTIVLYILNLIPSLLIMNRGMLVIIMMSCVFVYLIKYQHKITLKKIAGLSLLLVVFLYFFGVVGNMRVNNSYNTNTSMFDNSLFLQIGGATDEFKDSIIPEEFFWPYIYISSPLANLQETINNFEYENDITGSDTFVFSVTQVLPDFISKRIVGSYEINIPNSLQITPELNVSTAFAQSYVILGWVGISLLIMFMFGFALFYILLLKNLNSDYFIVGLAILNSIFVFNTFSNMFSFTGLSFQLVYPLLFTLFSKKKPVTRGKVL